MRYKNFNEVDDDLRRICELEVELSKIEGKITLKCNEIKDSYAEEVGAIVRELHFLMQEIENYCNANKAEFAEKRSKELIFGTIGYRISKSVPLPRNKDKILNLIKNIKQYGFKGCIIHEEKPNKDGLCELDDASLVKLGLKRIVKDNFRIEPKLETMNVD